MPHGSAADDTVELVPRPMEERLAELEQQVRQASPSAAPDLYANGLRRLLNKACNAGEMRTLFQAIDAMPGLLHSHPRLLLALADHGPLMARHDPALLVEISERCIAAAHDQPEPEAIWNALARTADALPLDALQALGDCWQGHLQFMPTKAIGDYAELRVLINSRVASAQAAPHPETVEQAIARTVAFAATMAPERALASLALGLSELLDEDSVHTPAHWQALKEQLSPALLAAHAPLRLRLAQQLLKSPEAPAELVRDIATLCLKASSDTHGLLPVWNEFSLAIQSGSLPQTQSLFEAMSASVHNQPPAAREPFERARASLASQQTQPWH